MSRWQQLFVLFLVGGAFLLWQRHERSNTDEAEWCLGLPASTEKGLRHQTLVLRNAGFSVGYSEVLANPLWVSYRLEYPTYPAPDSRPKSGFRPDERSLRAISADAFRGSGYQRGHLAPNYAMYRVHGPQAQQDSFLMTNVSPQRPHLNQKAWQRIEEIVMDRMLPDNGPLCIVTGPVFADDPRILPSGVAVPSAFYKILITAEENPRVLAFVVPQNVSGYEPLDRFLVSVDEVERRTGLDFLTRLENATESRLESKIRRDWGLDAVARLPPRY